jgi:hypothetical protein
MSKTDVTEFVYKENGVWFPIESSNVVVVVVVASVAEAGALAQ